MNKLTSITAVALVIFCGGADRDNVLQWGQTSTARFYQGDTGTLWKNMSPEMQQAFGKSEALDQFRDQVDTQLGAEQAVISEKVVSAGDNNVYLRTARFEKLKQLIHVQWVFDDSGIVVGFVVRPVAAPAPSEYLDYQTKTTLRLPFEGEWDVFWGGRSIEENYHAVTSDQRFAYDILIFENDSTHRGDGKQSEDYYCFGKTIVAPGDGRVHAAENNVEDNVPGKMNPREALGNHVIIDHGNGEFSFMAHFKQGSVIVKPGDQIVAGQVLGQCGNSGNTTEPHLHYHLQTTRDFQQGDGLPAQFQNYIADGQPVERGEPVKGQRVAAGQPARDD